MPLLSVFQFLGRMRKSGRLTVEMAGETVEFEFANGKVQRCESTRPAAGERTGEILIESRACSAAAMSDLLARIGPSISEPATEGATVGEAAVQAGLVTNGQLLEALELQVQRRFRRCSADPSAAYEFHEGAAARTDGRMLIAPAELGRQSIMGPSNSRPGRPSPGQQSPRQQSPGQR